MEPSRKAEGPLLMDALACHDKLTARDIEIAVARHFGYRQNLIVPNVYWGWGLLHEADLIVMRPSGYVDEIEIKTTASDIRADARKRNGHWDDKRIARVWFAVPHTLSDHQDIPAGAGILSVTRRAWGTGYEDRVTVTRTARMRSKATRIRISDSDRMKLAELGAMRVWSLKTALTMAAARG